MTGDTYHLCPICGREAMDLQIGRCTHCGLDLGGVNADIYYAACDRLREDTRQLEELLDQLKGEKVEIERDISERFGKDKLDIAKGAFDKGFEAGIEFGASESLGGLSVSPEHVIDLLKDLLAEDGAGLSLLSDSMRVRLRSALDLIKTEEDAV